MLDKTIDCINKVIDKLNTLADKPLTLESTVLKQVIKTLENIKNRAENTLWDFELPKDIENAVTYIFDVKEPDYDKLFNKHLGIK